MARSSSPTRPTLATLLTVLLLLQVMALAVPQWEPKAPRELAEAPDEAALAAGRAPANTICSDVQQPNGANQSATGQCDDWNSAHDESPESQEWVVARYEFDMIDTDTIEMRVFWDIHEFNRSQITLDIDLGGASLPTHDGIPADYIRNYFNVLVSGGQTVKNLLVQETQNSVTRLINDGFGLASNVQVQITGGDNPYADSQDEPASTGSPVPSIPNNAFQPPVQMEVTATVELDTSTFSIANNSELEVERALQAILTMGANITTDFKVFARNGHIATFELRPPDYATMIGVDNTGRLEVRSQDGFQYRIGAWDIDNRGAVQGADEAERNVSVTLSRRASQATRAVQIDTLNQKGVDVSITLDMSDTMAILEVVIQMFYVDQATFDAWGLSVIQDNGLVDMPWVTSDGIRWAHDNGLLNLSELTEAIPTDAIADGLSGFAQEPVVMQPVEWSSPDSNGGLLFAHRSGETCNEAGAPHYCIAGSNAMNSTYPVYIKTESRPFRMSLIDLAAQKAGDKAPGDFNFSVLEESDLEGILNAGLKIEVDLGDDFINDLIPPELPPSEVTVTINLPDWAESTNESEPGILQLKRLTNGSAISSIGIQGTRPYVWDNHPIKNQDGETVCSAQEKTCIQVDLKLDFIDLEVKEWQRAVELTLSGEVTLHVYRIGIPDGVLDQAGALITLKVIPSDLIRLLVDIADRGEPVSFDVPFGDGEDATDLTIEMSNDGIDRFLQDVSKIINDNLSAAGDKAAQESGEGGPTLDIDLSGIKVIAEKENIVALSSISITDEDPVDLRLSLAETTVTASYTDNTVRLGTGWVGAALSGIVNSLVGGFSSALPMAEADGTLGSGLTLPPNGEVLEVPAFESPSFSDDETGELIARPLLIVELSLPKGIGFGTLESENGTIEKSLVQGRQQVRYQAPRGQNDALSLTLVVEWGFFAGELAVYLAGVGGLVGLLVFRRIRKKARKEAILEEEFERASRMRTSAMDFDEVGGGTFGGGDDWGDDNW